jgi:glycosyltransferase involved in cell wall biosynthesis
MIKYNSRVVVWWVIPCKGILPLFELFQNLEVIFVFENRESDLRKELGWDVQLSNHNVIYLDESNNWVNTVDSILLMETKSLHIFNGIGIFPKIKRALNMAVLSGLMFVIMAEAPSNPYFGLIRVLKKYYSTYFAYKGKKYRKIVKSALGYIILSGDKKDILIKRGWSSNKLFPFGYFTKPVVHAESVDIDNRNVILLTGYLTRNKGHMLFLKAVIQLPQIQSYRIKITGYGPELKNLQIFCNKNNLNNVEFMGVISEEKMLGLFRETCCIVAPGFEEPWGIRVNEALSNGIYIICSSGLGASILIENGINGFLFDSGDINSLVEALKKGIDNQFLVKQPPYLINTNSAAIYLENLLINLINTHQKAIEFPKYI